MSKDEEAVENEIKSKGLTAPRLTPQHIDDQIIWEYSGRASDLFAGCPTHSSLSCLTITILVLKNGYTVVGKSACASPENFNAELGTKISRQDAREQIWALEGYALRNKLNV